MQVPDEDYAHAVARAEHVGVPVATYCKMVLRQDRLGVPGRSLAAAPSMIQRASTVPVAAASAFLSEVEGYDGEFDDEPAGGDADADAILARNFAAAQAEGRFSGSAPAMQEAVIGGEVMAIGHTAPAGHAREGAPRPGRYRIGG